MAYSINTKDLILLRICIDLRTDQNSCLKKKKRKSAETQKSKCLLD